MCRLITFSALLILTTSLWASGLQDPTQPIVSHNQKGKGSTQAAAVLLHGIFNRGENQYALINNQVMATGQRWQGIELLEIKRHSVILKIKQQTQEVLLTKQLDIKKDTLNDF